MKNSFFENIRKDTIQRLELLELQKKYEEGLILEEDMTEKQRIELEKLYDEQILELDIKISQKEKELKKKIIQNNEYYKMAIEQLKNKKVNS